jgi:hypothetical protein
MSKAIIALRFTSTRNEAGFTSEDQVNKVQFNGICAYDITSEVERMIDEDYTLEDAIEICALKQVKFDNWHASNTKGNYVAFNSEFVSHERDNQDFLGNRAVIVKLNDYIGFGQIDMGSANYKCLPFELVS